MAKFYLKTFKNAKRALHGEDETSDISVFGIHRNNYAKCRKLNLKPQPYGESKEYFKIFENKRGKFWVVPRCVTNFRSSGEDHK